MKLGVHFNQLVYFAANGCSTKFGKNYFIGLNITIFRYAFYSGMNYQLYIDSESDAHSSSYRHHFINDLECNNHSDDWTKPRNQNYWESPLSAGFPNHQNYLSRHNQPGKWARPENLQ